MLSDALQVPVSDWKKFLIGSAMYVIPWLSIFTGLFSYGYAVKYVRNLLSTRQHVLPEWTGWGTLLRDGFFATIIGLAYMIPALLLGILIVLGITMTGSYNPTVVGVFTALAVLFVIAGWYVIPAAVMEYISTSRLKTAFTLRMFVPVLKHRAYAKQWVLAFAVSIVLSLFVFAIASVSSNLLGDLGQAWSIIGMVLSTVIAALVAFYQLMCTFTLYAHGWLDAQEYHI